MKALRSLNNLFDEHKWTASRFMLVGSLGALINYSIFFIFFKLMGMNYLLSSATGYILSLILSFKLNKSFTFKHESKQQRIEATKYFIVCTSSLFLGLILLKSLVMVNINPLAANFFVMSLTTTLNYLGSKYLVFSHSRIIKKIDFLLYRYRYLLTYILIGLSSIFLEILMISLLTNLLDNIYLKTILGFMTGMIFSFFLNAKLNFKVPKEKNFETFRIFFIISVFAFLLNILLIKFIFNQVAMQNYSISRFLSAGSIFAVSYSLHRRFTFNDIKQVGIAIYLAEKENIKIINDKVKSYPDWIHLDLVDETFNESAKKIKLINGTEVRNAWGKIPIMTHIMSKKPSKWIEKVAPFSDYIIIHYEIEEPIEYVLEKISALKKKKGISILPTTKIKAIKKYFREIEIVQILGIKKPGESGQHLEAESIRELDLLNDVKESGKHHFDICFDGGVKLSNINKINAKYIVSGSTVLNSQDTAKSIYDLKTNSKYYYDHGSDLKKFLKNKILKTLDEIDFVKSGTIVGSFVDKEGIDGISDIDIIAIVDELTKKKFDEIVSRFESMRNMIKTDYDYNLKINTTFGPLKFNEEKLVVFHLMIYDMKGHIEHCKKSPFTCLDWQRSDTYVKEKMENIWKVTRLVPNYFFSARRSVKEYLSDLDANSISYREYKFEKNKVIEMKKSKKMDDKDRFEFAYHIMKSCMSNLIKLKSDENKAYSTEDLMKKYSEIFPRNIDRHSRYFLRLQGMKNKNEYKKWNQTDFTEVNSFMNDFESQFNETFYGSSKKIFFIRHAETKMNKKNLFIGQKTDIGIVNQDTKKFDGFIDKNKIRTAYSSPAKRCIETIKLFGNLKIILDESLKEINYGNADGNDLDWLKKNHPKIINDWKEGKDPKFPDGENTADVLKRVEKFLNGLKGEERIKNTLVCTHNVFLRCLIGDAYKVPIYKFHFIEVHHAEPFEFLLTTDGKIYPNIPIEKREQFLKKVSFGDD